MQHKIISAKANIQNAFSFVGLVFLCVHECVCVWLCARVESKRIGFLAVHQHFSGADSATNFDAKHIGPEHTFEPKHFANDKMETDRCYPNTIVFGRVCCSAAYHMRANLWTIAHSRRHSISLLMYSMHCMPMCTQHKHGPIMFSYKYKFVRMWR